MGGGGGLGGLDEKGSNHQVEEGVNRASAGG